MEITTKIYLLLVVYTAQVECGREMCDIRMWYLSLISDDVFNTNLTPDMLKLKQSVDTLALNSAEGPNSGKAECHVLDMYNAMLKEKFNYDYVSKHMAGEPSSTNSPEVNDNVDVAEENVDTKKNVKDVVHQNGIKIETVNSFTQGSSNENDDTRTNDNIVAHQKDIEEEDDTDIDETELLEENDDSLNDEAEEYNTSESDDTDDIMKEINDDSVKEGENNQSATNENDDKDDIDDIFTTRAIPIGVCWSFGCLQSDVFDVFGLDEIPVINGNEDDDDQKGNKYHANSQVIGHKDPSTTEKREIIRPPKEREKINFNSCFTNKKSCNYRCYYVFSHIMCITGYFVDDEITKTQNGIIDKNKVDIEEVFNNKMKDTNSHLDTHKTEKENKDINQSETKDSRHQAHAGGKSGSKSRKDKQVVTVTPSESSIKDETISDLATDNEQSKSEIENNSVYPKTGQESKDSITTLERENVNLIKEIQEVNSKLDRMEQISKSRNSLTQNENPTEHKMSVDAFEKIVHETTKEYAQKIQTLELNIMKLENQLLGERLHKQNHSSTITRLENLILRLENDFLKLNTQYDDMKTENENISKRQNYYLEVAFKKQKETCKQLQLPDKSTKTPELLSQHQSKITELTDILSNQSSIIKVIKDRYTSLEDQNRMLHQMIMNQTVFMTSIIQTMQSLTTQNNKNREEIEALKRGIAVKPDSIQDNAGTNIQKDSIIEAIDKYAIDDKINMIADDSGDENNNDETKEDDADVNLKLYLEQKSTEEIITHWCPALNDSCPLCFYRSILSVNCVPFKQLFWGHCGAHCKNRPIAQHKPSEADKIGKPYTDEIEINHADKSSAKSSNVKEAIIQKSESEAVTVDKNSAKEKDIKDSENSKSITNKEIVKDNEPKKKTDTRLVSENDIVKDHATIQKSDDAITQNSDDLKSNDLIIQKQDDVISQKSNKNKVISSEKDVPKKPDKNQEGKNTKTSSKPKGDAAGNKKSDKTPNLKETSSEKNTRPADGETAQLKDEKKQTKTKSDNKENVKKPEENTNPVTKKRKTPTNLESEKGHAPKDCYDYYRRGNKRDGIFKISPFGMEGMIDVFCDMKNGGWTVIQRRQDGTMNFFQKWADYKKGFGGLYGEHWLGNDRIHFLTNQNYYKLRVDLMDWNKTKKYAEFDYFLVENEENGYRINIDGYTGDAGDGLSKHSGHKFSTKDVDNDKVVKEFGGSCAVRFQGAGWYYKCYASNLNGKFYKGGKIPEKKYDGVTWKPWTGPNYSLKKVEMKIKPTTAS